MQRRSAAAHPLAAVLILVAMSFSGLSHADPAPTQRKIAVLTPAVPDKFLVHAGDLLPHESIYDAKKNGKLRDLAMASGFSVSERVSAPALEALRSWGWDAELRSMPRIAVGGPVRRENYPTDTGRLMLDIKVQLIGVRAGSFWGRLGPYTPVVEVKYVVLDAGGRLVQPSQNVYYCHSGPQPELEFLISLRTSTLEKHSRRYIAHVSYFGMWLAMAWHTTGTYEELLPLHGAGPRTGETLDSSTIPIAYVARVVPRRRTLR